MAVGLQSLTCLSMAVSSLNSFCKLVLKIKRSAHFITKLETASKGNALLRQPSAGGRAFGTPMNFHLCLKKNLKLESYFLCMQSLTFNSNWEGEKNADNFHRNLTSFAENLMD